jgi:hypothetical protein
MKKFTKNRVMSPNVQEKLYRLLYWSFDSEDEEVRQVCADLYDWLGIPGQYIDIKGHFLGDFEGTEQEEQEEQDD